MMVSKSELFDLAIIGGGAAGLTAAIFAAESRAHGQRIVVLDTAQKLGAKILVSGGGRCNVTHDKVAVSDFNGTKNVVKNVLAAFNVETTTRWFDAMNVQLKREATGKMFPVADSARVVVDALLGRCRELGVEFLTGHRVSAIAASLSAGVFDIGHSYGNVQSRCVVVATGGRSLPRTGSDGTAWQMLQQLGHTVSPTYAALVPLVLPPQMFHAALAGISQEVELSTFVGGKRIDHRTGSMLWTHFGLSGPVVMDASRHWAIAHETGQQPSVLCSLLPGETFESVERWLVDSTASRPKLQFLNLVSERLTKRVAIELLQHLRIDPSTPMGHLSRDARRVLVHGLTALVLPVTQHRGWNYAEVTAGGVPLAEIDYRTMQSRIVPGLYLAGETLDCDGRIGGFNFQWAWATGYLAGRAAISAAAKTR